MNLDRTKANRSPPSIRRFVVAAADLLGCWHDLSPEKASASRSAERAKVSEGVKCRTNGMRRADTDRGCHYGDRDPGLPANLASMSELRFGNHAPHWSQIEAAFTRGQPVAIRFGRSGNGMSGPCSASNLATLSRPRRSHFRQATSSLFQPGRCHVGQQPRAVFGHLGLSALVDLDLMEWNACRYGATICYCLGFVHR